jgi:hypothetical protein
MKPPNAGSSTTAGITFTPPLPAPTSFSQSAYGADIGAENEEDRW